MDQKSSEGVPGAAGPEEAADPGGLQQEQELRQGGRRRRARRTSPTRRRTPTPRSSSSASRTPSATCCSWSTRRSCASTTRRFGVCVSCEDEMNLKRLEAVPWARLCLALPGEAGVGTAVSHRCVPRRDLAAATVTRLLVDPVLAVVFPSQCPACGAAPGPPRPGPAVRALLGRPARATGRRSAAAGCPCPAAGGAAGAAGAGVSPSRAGASLGPYEGALRVAIHELKYRGRRRVAARLAEAAARGRPRAPSWRPRRARAGAPAPAGACGSGASTRPSSSPASSRAARGSASATTRSSGGATPRPRPASPPRRGGATCARRSRCAGRPSVAGRVVTLRGRRVDDRGDRPRLCPCPERGGGRRGAAAVGGAGRVRRGRPPGRGQSKGDEAMRARVAVSRLVGAAAVLAAAGTVGRTPPAPETARGASWTPPSRW